MAAELGETSDPKRLVPGDVGSVTRTMWSMRSYGDSLSEAGTGLSRIDTQDGWRGEAADQFRDRFHGEPRKWLEAGDSFHSAANALDSYASTLQWAQQEADGAVSLWNQGEADTATAKAEHARAVAQAQQDARDRTARGLPTSPITIPFSDPGEAKRAAARQKLNDARSRLREAGDRAERAVGAARDKAPKKPGFWSHVGDSLKHLGEGAVNGMASFGNATLNHPGDMLGVVGGLGLTVLSGMGDGLGLVLDATGVGALGGGPLNAVSTVGVVTGVGITAAAVGDLAQHAATDDQVSPMRSGDADSGGTFGRAGTKTDRLKEHLTEKDLDAARRELDGEVVATKSNGQPWDHVDEVRNAQRGLVNRIDQLKRQLGDSRISDADKSVLQTELSEASRLLDHSEQYVPRN